MNSTMLHIFYGLSGDTPPAERWHPVLPDSHSQMFSGMPDVVKLPSWLTESDLDSFVESFQRSGFRGGLNWYRNTDRNWELLAAYSEAHIPQPTLFIWGDEDATLEISGTMKRIERMSSVVPQLQSILIKGASHWIQLERAEEVNTALIAFFKNLNM